MTRDIDVLNDIAAAAGIETGAAFTAEGVVQRLRSFTSLRDATERLRGLSVHDIREATQEERIEFVMVCHDLAVEIHHENARGTA